MKLHDKLVQLVTRKVEDYEPWGAVRRWEEPEQPYPDCSGGCRHALWLEGELGSDWCVCSNEKSHRAGMLTFEHQGCQKFEGEA